MIKITLFVPLFCVLAYLYIAALYDNPSSNETIAISTPDKEGVQTTLQTENIPYHYNATQNTQNFYFLEVFDQTKSTAPMRTISKYAPCNRISKYAVMGMDAHKSFDELETYSYIPFLYKAYGFECKPFKWKPFKLTKEVTAYTDRKGIGYTKFTYNGCTYKIQQGTKENCLALMSSLADFPNLREIYAQYRDGVLCSIQVMFIEEKYIYFFRTSFGEDLDGFAAALRAMQKEPPDDNDFTQSLIQFMDEQCRVPILLPAGYGPFTNAQ